MEIRFAIREDVPAILQLLKQVGAVHHAGRPDIFRENAQKYGPSQVLSMLDSILIAAEGGQVLGYCFCMVQTHKNDPVMTDRRELYIDDLCVEQALRGRGVGTALYARAVAYAKEQNCSSVTLNVWCCNESAMGFYEGLGMKPRKIGMEMGLEDA